MTMERQGFSDVMSVVRAVFCGLVVGNGGRGNRRNGTLPPPHVYHLPLVFLPIVHRSRSSPDLSPDHRSLVPAIDAHRVDTSIRLCFSALVPRPLYTVSRAASLVIAREIGDASHKSVSWKRTPVGSSSNLSAPSFLLAFEPLSPFEMRFNRRIDAYD